MTTNKIWQEFYCTISGGGCGGYFMVTLNEAIDHIVDVVCPNCNHKHRRSIVRGVIKEDSRYAGSVIEEIYPPRSAYSKEPKTRCMKDKTKNERDGALVKSDKDLIRDIYLWELWQGRFGGGSHADGVVGEK